MSSTDINTDNIDNITVLKGAAATALYGAEARSGVIVITSKESKAGETYITVDHNTVASTVSRFTLIKMNMVVDMIKLGYFYLQSCT